jgi:hypothetical protein
VEGKKMNLHQTILHDDIGDLVKFKNEMTINMRDLNWDGVAWVPRPDDLAKLEKTKKAFSDQLTGMQLLNDKVDALVKLKENLRWRKWPEEKPEDTEDCLMMSSPQTIAIGFHDGQTWCQYHECCSYNGEYKYSDQVTHWLPLSTLPEPEGEK